MGSKKRKKTGGNPATRARQAGARPTSSPDSASGEARTGAARVASVPAVPAGLVRKGSGDAGAGRPTSTSKAPGTARKQDTFFVLPIDETHPPSRGCAAALDDVEPHGIAATYSFAAPEAGSYTTAIRFLGRRKDIDGAQPGPADQFDRTERVSLVGDGGQVSLTTRVKGVNPGQWRVVADAVTTLPDGTTRQHPRRVVETHTRFFTLAQGPRVQVWSWPLLVGLGAVVALVMQAWLANRTGIDVSSVLVLSLLGCLLGFVGGKVWYLALHRKPLKEFLHSGACIQGFLLVSLGVLAVGSAILSLPLRSVLDVTTPGIFLGVAVGRPGCFLTGCCTGRPTTSAWGLVSSDRRLTLRRNPVQLVEAAAGLVIGVLGLVAVLAGVPVPGSLFVASIAGYTLVRQVLFPLRADSHTRVGRIVTMIIAGLVVAGAAATFAVG